MDQDEPSPQARSLNLPALAPESLASPAAESEMYNSNANQFDGSLVKIGCWMSSFKKN